MIYNPDIIIKCLSTQATYINRKYGQMFYYTDKGQIWYDLSNGGRMLASDIYILNYERERNNFIPDNRSTLATELDVISNDQEYLNSMYVYVVETNCLYAYLYAARVWSRIYGVYGQTTVGQTYLPDGNAVIINADDVTTNGILNDGSVVIRDENRMICGLVKSDGYTLTLQSLIGGQINLEPSSKNNGSGCLQINAENESANLNGDLTVFGNIKVVNKNNWKKQYRLTTEDIIITTNTTIKAGSTLKAGSILDNTKYDTDTKLNIDTRAENGLIVLGSKLYIGTIINNTIIKPPYLFDIDEVTEDTFISNSKDVSNLMYELQESGTILYIKMPTNFVNSGDCCYINTSNIDDISKISKVRFEAGTSYTEYPVDYINTVGTSRTARIIFYALNSTVKILP